MAISNILAKFRR